MRRAEPDHQPGSCSKRRPELVNVARRGFRRARRPLCARRIDYALRPRAHSRRVGPCRGTAPHGSVRSMRSKAAITMAAPAWQDPAVQTPCSCASPRWRDRAGLVRQTRERRVGGISGEVLYTTACGDPRPPEPNTAGSDSQDANKYPRRHPCGEDRDPPRIRSPAAHDRLGFCSLTRDKRPLLMRVKERPRIRAA